MCLIVFAYRQHRDFPFVFAANRDEFYGRPAAPAAFWDEEPDLLAGRDLAAGGTWCGVTRSGRFAAITNYRDLRSHDPDAPSRGTLVTDYLLGTHPPADYLARISADAARYNGFNLLTADRDALCYYSNREGVVRTLAPGVYGLSNHLLDTPWPKVVRAREALQALLAVPAVDPEPYFTLLADETRALDEALPDTGIGRAWERMLSSVFIQSPDYGTRASTVLWIDRDGHVSFEERTFDAAAGPPVTRRFRFRMTNAE